MPELTSQDRESYQKLYMAATKLNSEIAKKTTADFTILKSLTTQFLKSLLKPEDLSSFEQLQSRVELTGGYLVMYQLFVDALEQNSTTTDGIDQESQELRKQYNQLKLSLAEVDDDFLDGLSTPCSDPLFLSLLTDKSVKKWTDQILSDRLPALTDSEVQTLTKAWGTAVAKFVEDARTQGAVVPGKAETIAQFFCIHSQLEDLYSTLSKAVASNS
jgi:hypothetical protein